MNCAKTQRLAIFNLNFGSSLLLIISMSERASYLLCNVSATEALADR